MQLATIKFPADVLDSLEIAMQEPRHGEEHANDQALFDQEVTFPDGRRAAIQVFESVYPNQPAWAQMVLYSPEGYELGMVCDDNRVRGEWEIWCDTRYRVTVVPS